MGTLETVEPLVAAINGTGRSRTDAKRVLLSQVHADNRPVSAPLDR